MRKKPLDMLSLSIALSALAASIWYLGAKLQGPASEADKVPTSEAATVAPPLPVPELHPQLLAPSKPPAPQPVVRPPAPEPPEGESDQAGKIEQVTTSLVGLEIQDWRTRKLLELLRDELHVSRPITEDERDQLELVLNQWRGLAERTAMANFEEVKKIVDGLEAIGEYVEFEQGALRQPPPARDNHALRHILARNTQEGKIRQFVVESTRFPILLEHQEKMRENYRKLLEDSLSVLNGDGAWRHRFDGDP